MRINIITVGKKHDTLVSDFILEYQKRVEKYFKLEWVLVDHSDKKEESEKILKKVDEGDFVILLDERGKNLDNLELKNIFEKVMVAGNKKIVFVIGGAYGVEEEVFKKANLVLSLSKLVYPHMLVRAILTEQIYRTISIIKGEKYHHS